MKKTLILLLICITSFYFTGCWDQKIYERMGFIQIIGIELSEDNKLIISSTLPVVDPAANERIEIISSSETLLRGFRESSRRISSKITEGGKLRQFCVSASIAKYGIKGLLEVFERDPTNPIIPYILVVEGSPKEMFEASRQFGDKPRIAIYLDQLMDTNITQSYIPETRIYRFDSLYFSPGIDPMLPTIKLESGKLPGVRVTGSALFSEDKMVGKIDTKQTSMLLAMMGKMKKTVFISSSLDNSKEQIGKSGAAITFKKPKRKLSIKFKDGVPTVNISLSFKGALEEYHWNSIYDDTTKKSIEEILSKEVTDECMKVLSYTQGVGSDPIGIGDLVRAKYHKYWNEDKWVDDYQNVKFIVNAKVTIVNHGGIN